MKRDKVKIGPRVPSKQALADYLCLDVADLDEMRYQAGKGILPMYAFEHGKYLCFTGDYHSRLPLRNELNWEAIKDKPAHLKDYHIYRAD